jgi:hypothetical protein
MIYHVDFDKAWRCPRECGGGHVSWEETGWRFKRWHVYTCDNCGLRVAKGLLIPHHPESGYTWRGRAEWFWWTRPRVRWSEWYWPHYGRKAERAVARWIGR